MNDHAGMGLHRPIVFRFMLVLHNDTSVL